MEDTLGGLLKIHYINKQKSLNPYSNGRYSRRVHTELETYKPVCLNPYSNGTLSDGEERRRGCKAWCES